MPPFRSRLLVLGLLVLSSVISPDRAAANRSMILATTTSVRDSGLLDEVLPRFTQASGIKVQVIAVGTGAALRMGREGNADLLLTHAPSAEQKLVDEKIARRRTPFMENYFVIAGPPSDPAKIATAQSPEQAIIRIAGSDAPWISRADDSGTHKREKALFAAAGFTSDTGFPGVVQTGSGMGLTLQVAGERRGYLLSDIGTFLTFQKRTDLKALSQPSDSLRNIYSLLQLDSARFPRPLRTEEAEELERFLLDETTQRAIGAFGQEKFGRPLFTPLALPGAPSVNTVD